MPGKSVWQGLGDLGRGVGNAADTIREANEKRRIREETIKALKESRPDLTDQQAARWADTGIEPPKLPQQQPGVETTTAGFERLMLGKERPADTSVTGDPLPVGLGKMPDNIMPVTPAILDALRGVKETRGYRGQDKPELVGGSQQVQEEKPRIGLADLFKPKGIEKATMPGRDMPGEKQIRQQGIDTVEKVKRMLSVFPDIPDEQKQGYITQAISGAKTLDEIQGELNQHANMTANALLGKGDKEAILGLQKLGKITPTTAGGWLGYGRKKSGGKDTTLAQFEVRKAQINSYYNPSRAKAVEQFKPEALKIVGPIEKSSAYNDKEYKTLLNKQVSSLINNARLIETEKLYKEKMAYLDQLMQESGGDAGVWSDVLEAELEATEDMEAELEALKAEMQELMKEK